jgi:serine/threonine protein kinase
MYEDESYELIKIIDFGESILYKNKEISNAAGSLEYCAPEVLQY